jgi:type I restriction enzyme M protein
LDGLEVTEIRYSEIIADDKGFRVDPEYYQQQYLELEKLLKSKNAETLESISVSIINFGAYSLTNQINYLDEGVPFLNVGDIKENTINLSTAKLIDETLSKDLLHKSLVKDGQVLLTIAGTIGNAAVAYKLPPATNSNQAIANITLHKGISPFYISTFLNSYFGKSQTKRLIISNVQPNLLLTQVKQIQIVLLSDDFQKQIEKTVKSANAKLEQSKRLYAEAEEILLEELGLKNWRPPKESAAVKSFKESFGKSGRLDAEFYQPKYDALLRTISKSGFPVEQLGTLIEPITNGYDSREYTEEGTPYIRVGDVKNGRIDIEGAVKIPVNIADVDKDVSLKLGDVLFTRKGSFGNAAVVREDALHTIISSEIMLLRLLPEKKIIPDYISLYLNSFLGYMQVERKVHGVAYYSISQPDLATIQIALPPKSVQSRIEKKIQESLSTLQESKRLLELSKRAVESAIEKGEKAGLKVLE